MIDVKNKIKFKLPLQGLFRPTGPTDPLNFYYKPLVGSLYIKRIQAGLDLLDRQYKSVLEFGYGSGLLLPTINGFAEEITGVDIDSEPATVKLALAKLKINAELIRGDITRIGLPVGAFDLVIAFSVFEHIGDADPVLKEMHRLLKSGGELLVGMPRVDKGMSKLFSLIGFNKIEEHHVASYKDFLKQANNYFRPIKFSSLPKFLPKTMGLYFNMLFKKD